MALKLVQDAGCELRVIIDRAQSSRNEEQRRVLSQATSTGLQVLYATGHTLKPHYQAVGRSCSNFPGALRAKSLCLKSLVAVINEQVHAIVGSQNWTTASRGNHEVAVLLEVPLQGAVARDLIDRAEKVVRFGRSSTDWAIQESSTVARNKQKR